MAKSRSNSGTRTPMTSPAAARIQGATARTTGGAVAKHSFATRAMSAAAHNGSGQFGSNK